jgi:hypothetical protein
MPPKVILLETDECGTANKTFFYTSDVIYRPSIFITQYPSTRQVKIYVTDVALGLPQKPVNILVSATGATVMLL